MNLRILSRKSDLAQIQSKFVGYELFKKFPKLNISYLTKTTEGDINKKSPLSEMKSTGVFTDDLRKSLINKQCDIVVHSWKDLPIDIGKNTTISGSLKRADERDILLIDRKKISQIKKLKKISILSSSPRRVHNLKNFISNYFPYKCNDVAFHNVRGNIPTRIKKLLEGKQDALIVAKAAIDRLIDNPFQEFNFISKEIKNYLKKCSWMILPLSLNPCAPGQGALAIEIRIEDIKLDKMIKSISDPLSMICVNKEREILKKYGGGCHQKIGISFFPTFFGIVKSEKGESENGNIFQDWSITKPENKIIDKVKKSEIFPENLIDYKFYKRIPLKNSLKKINSLKNHCIWISRKSSLPDNSLLSLNNIIWTSGLKTWKALSKRGIWVNGTSDGMGEDFNPNISNLCKLPWIKLTHTKSPTSNIKNVIHTYELIDEENLPNFSNKKYFFWMSFSAFKIAISKDPSILKANHACGPGNTFKEIKKMLKDPKKLTIYLSYEQWRKNLINE